jgi:hypothetical protein
MEPMFNACRSTQEESGCVSRKELIAHPDHMYEMTLSRPKEKKNDEKELPTCRFHIDRSRLVVRSKQACVDSES